MSERRAIVRATGLLGAMTVLSRVTGLVRDVVVGSLFGAGMAADAFFVAYRIPNLLRRLVAEGATTAAFIPIFTGYLERESRAEAERVARILGTVMAIVLAVITVAGMLLAKPITELFAPGFAAVPGKLELTTSLTRLVFPYIFCIGMVAAAMGVLNSLRNFSAPAISPIVMNVVMVIVAIVLAPSLGIYSLAAGVVLGGMAQVVSQIPALRREGIGLRPLLEPRHPSVLRLGALMLPTVFGSAVYQINVVVSTMFASLLPSGSVAYLWYAERLFEFPLGVFAVALGTAALPSFASLAKRDLVEFRATVGFALRLVNLVAVPAAVGLVLVADPVTSVLFLRGEFSGEAARQTSFAVRCYACGLWSVASVRVLVPAFYALEDTRTPVVTAAGAFLANLVFVVLLIGPLRPADSMLGSGLVTLVDAAGLFDLRHGGLALATSLAATVNLVLLAAVLGWRVGDFGVGAWMRSAVRAGAASAAMIPPVLLVTSRIDWFSPGVPLPVRCVWLGVALAVGGAACAGALLLLGGPEVATFRAGVRRRWRRHAA